MTTYKLKPVTIQEPERIQVLDNDGEERPIDLCTPPVIVNQEESYYYDQLYVIGNEYGHICAVWADNESDALDEAFNLGKLDCFKVDESGLDDDMEYTYLGNAGEVCNLDYAWITEVQL